MFAFIQNFTAEEKEYFSYPFPSPTTVCRMSLTLRDERSNEELFQISCNSIVTDHVHAEIVAYNLIEINLFYLIMKHHTPHSVLDFQISLNNSPCGDCRKRILGWVNKLQEFTSLRLILFFSHLYYTDVKPGDSIVDLFTEWILSLVEIRTVVFICPLIVSNMVLKEDINRLSGKEMGEVEQRDYTCIKYIQDIFQGIKTSKMEYVEWFSGYPLFAEANTLPLHIFSWEEPIHIAIYPKDKHNLSRLIMYLHIPRSYQEIYSRSKKTEQRTLFLNS